MQLFRDEENIAVGSIPCGKAFTFTASTDGPGGGIKPPNKLGWGLLPLGSPGGILIVDASDVTGQGGSSGTGLAWLPIGAANTQITSNGTSVAWSARYVTQALSATGAIASTTSVVFGTSGSGAAVTLSLPAAASVPAGRELKIIKIDAGTTALGVAASGSDHINGGTSVSLASQYDYIDIVSDGTSVWYEVGALTS